jgi:hypothetical protein
MKFVIFSMLLTPNDSNIYPMPPSNEIEVDVSRRRGKGNRGKRRGGGGLR